MSQFMKYIIVFFISMVPIIELRGAVPIAISAFHLPLIPAFAVCILGNMLPVPIIYLFARKVLVWGSDKPLIGKLFTFFLEKGEKAGKKLLSHTGKGAYYGLFLFVGIPLPGTGAWTGTLAASILNLEFKKTVLACMAGVILAGIIMATVSYGAFGILGL